MSIVIADLATGAESESLKISEIRQSLDQLAGKITVVELEAKAKQFHEVIATADFSPSLDAEKNIADAGAVAVAILGYQIAKDMNISDVNQTTLRAIDSFLDKVNRAIVKDWKDLPVCLNVRPPVGTPKAAAGMNPNAIVDLKLRQEYLDRIAENQNNNLKNRQQRELRSVRRKILFTFYGLSISDESKERWRRSQVYERFAKDKESKLILDEAFEFSGK